MHLSRKSKCLWALLPVVLLTIALAFYLALQQFTQMAVGFHQQSVTRELARWGPEHSSISSDRDALAAVETLEYISRYYLPGPGYHASSDIEARLTQQRQETIAQISSALEKHTGLKFGTNLAQWQHWATAKRQELPPPP